MGKTYCFGLHPQGSLYLIAIVDIILGFVSTLLSIVALVNLQKVFGQLTSDQFDEQFRHPSGSGSGSGAGGGSSPLFSDHDHDLEDDGPDGSMNDDQTQSGINEFAHMHGQMIIVLLLSLFYLILALGLLLGIRKEFDCPIKAWFIYGCTVTLFAGISVIVLTVASGRLLWLLLTFLIVVRVYEIWVVYDFLKQSRFSSLIPSLTIRSASTERLHNV